ncbi:MAG: hypothetical protein VKJ64_08345, partial [Leptolyngbyaceae bacterium]|nr:hypothetical protein [Leptolyngbyaceae bacterium]
YRVVTQPQQSIAVCCDRLPTPRAHLLTLTLLISFGLICIHTVNSRWSNVRGIDVIEGRAMVRTPSLITLIGISLMPFIVLMLGSVLTQVIAKQRVKWQLSHFLSGITLLPLSGIILAWGRVSVPLFGLISLICGGYLLLLLYGGYRYSLHCHQAIARTSAICLTGIIALPIVLLTV